MLALLLVVFLGRYTLREIVSKTERGCVYTAELHGDAGFRRGATIITLDGNDPGLVASFVSSARTASTLSHPGIPRVFDMGFDDGRYFYAREQVSGASLAGLARELSARGIAFDLNVALFFALRVTEAIAHAHQLEAGAVHRQLSSENVRISERGDVKVTGFGGEAFLESAEHRHAPELTVGHDHDKRSNVYDIASIIEEMLVGVATPPELASILVRAGDANRERRYPNAGSLFTALRGLVNQRGLVTSAPQVAAWLASARHARPVLTSAPMAMPHTHPPAPRPMATYPIQSPPPPRTRMARGSSCAETLEPSYPSYPPRVMQHPMPSLTTPTPIPTPNPAALIATPQRQGESGWTTTLAMLIVALALFAGAVAVTIALS